jgi:alkaline phosphatase
MFFVASLIVIVTPGQDMVLVMSRSLSQGSIASIATAAGVSVGLVGTHHLRDPRPGRAAAGVRRRPGWAS